MKTKLNLIDYFLFAMYVVFHFWTKEIFTGTTKYSFRKLNGITIFEKQIRHDSKYNYRYMAIEINKGKVTQYYTDKFICSNNMF